MRQVNPGSPEAALDYVLSRWVRPGLLVGATTAVLADLRTEGYRLVRDDDATVERMADAMAYFDEACDHWPRRGVSLNYYRGLARAALVATQKGPA